MAYTREINLDEATQTRLAAYIDDELIRHYSERGDFVSQIDRWQIDYDATPSTTEGTFPFKGAAMIIIPLAAITVEAIYARTMTTMFALSQIVSCKPMSSQWADHARPVEKFLDQELMKRIGIHKPLGSSILELIKYGTGVAKTGYCKITKTAVRELEDGKEEEFEVTIKQNATVDSIPFSRFLMPFVYQDPQTAAWCGEEHEYTPYEMRLHEVGGLFKKDTVKKLSAHYSTAPASGIMGNNEQKERSEAEEKREPVWPLKLKAVELWMAFDVDGSEDLYNKEAQRVALEGGDMDERLTNKFDKEIVVHYHPDSKTFLSCRYNWHLDLRRPYESGVYFPVEHRWVGLGVCKQVEQFQREITTQHRQRIDNATLANCRMLKISTLSKYGPDEPLFPGKIWFVDDVNQIDSFQLGEIYPSAYSNENMSLQYLQQRTGINEQNLGMPQVGTPGTATSDLARIQEGNKKGDYTYSNIKQFSDRVIQSTILNIKQFGAKAEIYYETVEGGQLVKDFFSQDYEKIKEQLLLEISIAGQKDNRLLDRQNQQQIAQLLTGYYDSMIGLAQAKQDPALLARIVDAGMRAGTETMKQILESFDVRNIDRIIVGELLNGGTATQVPPTAGSPGITGAIQGSGSVQPS